MAMNKIFFKSRLNFLAKKKKIEKKKEYIDFEAIEEFSDQEEKEEQKEEDNNLFIDDGEVDNTGGPTFYRKFINQARDPAEAVFDDGGSHLNTRDLQPEIYDIGPL